MSTTPTLLALIDAYAEARHTNGDSTYNATTKAARDAVVAALTQGAGEAVEPVATFVERADGRPVATAVWLNSMPNPDWDLEMLDSAYPQFAPHRLVDLVRAQQLQQAVVRALAPVQQAIRDYHYALDTRQHGGVAQGKAVGAIEEALGMHWQRGVELAARAPKEPPCSA